MGRDIILFSARPMFEGTKLSGSKWWSSLLYTHWVLSGEIMEEPFIQVREVNGSLLGEGRQHYPSHLEKLAARPEATNWMD